MVPLNDCPGSYVQPTMNTMTLLPAASVASPTLRIRGRDYAVTSYEHIDEVTGEVARGYRLTGKRGATYLTMRNVHHPEMMFVVGARSFTNTVMVGVWLSDAGGVLKVVGQ